MRAAALVVPSTSTTQSTVCVPECPANYWNNDGTCEGCGGSSSREAGTDDGFCACSESGEKVVGCKCLENQYVSEGTCTSCPSGTTRPAGADDGQCYCAAASPADTGCRCPEDQWNAGGTCTGCPAQSFRTGDLTDAVCICEEGFEEYDTVNGCKCPENEWNNGGTCEACPTGSSRAAGTLDALCTFFGQFDTCGDGWKSVSLDLGVVNPPSATSHTYSSTFSDQAPGQ
eukprot:23017-Rhodomonas_salina.1